MNRLFILVTASTFAASLASAAEFTNSARGYKLTFPDDWTAHQEEGDERDLDLSNKPYHPVEGGFVPPGGAIIFVSVEPRYNEIFRQDSTDEANLEVVSKNYEIVLRRNAASGQPAKITGVDSEVRASNEIRHIGNNVFRLMLWSTPDDPKNAEYDQILDAIAATITLVPVTPLPATPTLTPRSWMDTHSCSCAGETCDDGNSALPRFAFCTEGEEAICLCAWCKFDRVDEAYELAGDNDCSCERERDEDDWQLRCMPRSPTPLPSSH